MSEWVEVRSNYYNTEEKATYIDAWHTSSDEEEGTVVAKVFDNGTVEYLNNTAKTETNIQEEIKKVLKELNI